MKIRIFGRGFNYSQDGRGNRLVYHLKGCNMHCPWCSNPEGMSFDGECTEMDVSAMINEAVRSKPMFFDGGGVTFTGGEATAQSEALCEALKGLKNEGIDTAIETNGTFGHLVGLLPYIDRLMIDLKHPDSEKLRQVTGVGNGTTIKNIAAALSSGKDVLVRIPLINGFNNDPETFSRFAEMAGISVGVAVLSFFVGIAAKHFLGVEI